MIVSQLSSHCDIIKNRLWRQQQNEDRASETQGQCVKIVILSSFMDSLCYIRNKIVCMYSRDALFLCLLKCNFDIYLINTKITLSWVLKQLVTRVRTLFSIYFVDVITQPYPILKGSWTKESLKLWHEWVIIYHICMLLLITKHIKHWYLVL